MASRVSASDFLLRSVMAILEQPDRAKPLATADPMPEWYQVKRRSAQILWDDHPVDLPVPPAPVINATPGNLNMMNVLPRLYSD